MLRLPPLLSQSENSLATRLSRSSPLEFEYTEAKHGIALASRLSHATTCRKPISLHSLREVRRPVPSSLQRPVNAAALFRRQLQRRLTMTARLREIPYNYT